ncbi:MAG TPA: hypothetical protein VKZ60_14795 [Chloroflexota bacterium]|jgi:uncharacterized Zn finger protein (UPF0148 family)|nr:hypothetical protein [Chloroflexota bacterium]
MMRRPCPPPPSRCPRCRGPLYRCLDADYCCLYCGEYVYGGPSRDPAAAWDAMLPPRTPRLTQRQDTAA